MTNRIIKAIEHQTDISFDQVKSRARITEVSEARQITYYLLNKHCGFNNERIGRMIGVDHNSVRQGLKQIEYRMKTEKYIKFTIAEIEKTVSNFI